MDLEELESELRIMKLELSNATMEKVGLVKAIKETNKILTTLTKEINLIRTIELHEINNNTKELVTGKAVIKINTLT